MMVYVVEEVMMGFMGSVPYYNILERLVFWLLTRQIDDLTLLALVGPNILDLWVESSLIYDPSGKSC